MRLLLLLALTGCTAAPDPTPVPPTQLLSTRQKTCVYGPNNEVLGDASERPVALPANGWRVVVEGPLDDATTAALREAGVRELELAGGGLDAVARVDREQVARLSSIASLQRLRIMLPWQVQAGDLSALAALPGLQRLDLGVRHVARGALGDLRGLPALRRLDLAWTRSVDPEAWQELAVLARLESLGAGGQPSNFSLVNAIPKLGDEQVRTIAKLGSLRELDLSDATDSITDAGLAHLATMPQLERLTLDGCWGFGARGLTSLARSTSLRELSLAGSDRAITDIDDDGLVALAGLSKLRVLRLGFKDSVCEERSWEALGRLRELEVLDMGELWLDDAGIEVLERLPRLRDLRAAIGETSRAALLRLAGLRALETLELSGEGEDGRQIDDAWLARIAGRSGLVELRLGDLCADYGDAGLAALAGASGLRELRLHGRFTDVGLRSLGACTQLEHASLESRSITPAGVRAFAKSHALRTFMVISDGVRQSDLDSLGPQGAFWAMGSDECDCGR